MIEKLETIAQEFSELNEQLTDTSVLEDHTQVTRISQRIAELKPVVDAFSAWKKATAELADAEELMRDSDDPEMKVLAEEEFKELKAKVEHLEPELQKALIPKDPDDSKNIVLEIRAGTGGDEAALFAADLYRMYLRFAERQNWRIQETERNAIGIGGVKEVVALIEGKDVFSKFKFESGVHRVQRIPETESGGRIHTSACTVAILPESEDVELDIEDKDLRIDTFRAQGAGGQHVNKTESAVRITHIPSGFVVSCQDEKSQHKNKARAMKVLRARLQDHLEQEAHAERAAERKSKVGSGDRSERIRTYNFPQNRVTDHRINLTLHKLDQLLEGDLNEMIDALITADMAERLSSADQS